MPKSRETRKLMLAFRLISIWLLLEFLETEITITNYRYRDLLTWSAHINKLKLTWFQEIKKNF